MFSSVNDVRGLPSLSASSRVKLPDEDNHSLMQASFLLSTGLCLNHA
ncbi:unnamed protein product [Acanthoscelides obtectus]|uniref:Uncharacterized protein n=1 Tax=Acanthoscelides obtectus TaxID=200917 RepID=A0A9P0JIK9_ACAOB|nr:unnamed protein product [Acanthoscelides obtectus]CAK1657976.1 hypothetical protein AOBTE_LOCUS20634 [Acanthoscelides obtectus]